MDYNYFDWYIRIVEYLTISAYMYFLIFKYIDSK